MTHQEEKWLAEYHRKEAGNGIKMQYRALVFWAIFAVLCLILVFSREERKFTFLDSLFVIMIVLNVGDLVRKIICNKRILAQTPHPAKCEDPQHAKGAEEA